MGSRGSGYEAPNYVAYRQNESGKWTPVHPGDDLSFLSEKEREGIEWSFSRGEDTVYLGGLTESQKNAIEESRYKVEKATNPYANMTKEQIQQLSGLTTGEFSKLTSQQQSWYNQKLDKEIEKEKEAINKEAENMYKWYMGDNSAVPPSQFKAEQTLSEKIKEEKAASAANKPRNYVSPKKAVEIRGDKVPDTVAKAMGWKK